MTEKMKFFMYLLNIIPHTKTRKQEKCLESGKRKELFKNIRQLLDLSYGTD